MSVLGIFNESLGVSIGNVSLIMVDFHVDSIRRSGVDDVIIDGFEEFSSRLGGLRALISRSFQNLLVMI